MADERGRLIARLREANAKIDALRKEANALERVFLKRKTPLAMGKAERAWLHAERQLAVWQGKARERMEVLASYDKSHRPKGRRGEYRYHPRYSSRSKKGHYQNVEIFFQRRDKGRMTDYEVLQAVSDLAAGLKRSDLVLGAVRYGPKRPRLAANPRQALGDFAAIFAGGALDDIGEEQL